MDARDWLGDMVIIDDSIQEGWPDCAGNLTGLGSSYDAERFWCDMLTDEGVPINTLVDMYDLCDARNWELQIDTDPGELDTNPFRRLEAAANTKLVDEQYDRQKNNGVDHGP